MVFYVLESSGNKIVSPPTHNLLDPKEAIRDIKKDTHRSISDMTSGTCMVRLYSNGCVHCHNMKNEYMALNTDSLNGINILDIEVGSGDYRNHDAPWVSETMHKGVPHIFVMKNEKILGEYSGDRTTGDMIEFIEKYTDIPKKSSLPSNKLKYLPSSIPIHKKTMKKNSRGKRGKRGKRGTRDKRGTIGKKRKQIRRP